MVAIFVTILCFNHLVSKAEKGSFFIHFPRPRENPDRQTHDRNKEYPQKVTIAGTVPRPSENTRGFFFGKLDGEGGF